MARLLIQYNHSAGKMILQKEVTDMALSVDSKVKELMKNEAAADLLEKYAPGFKTNPQMKLVGALTFRKLASFPQAGLDAAKVEEIDAALKALGE